jgi:hypothetical protein
MVAAHKPGMTYAQNAITDRADIIIRDLAGAALRGEMPETEARWRIFAEIEATEIPEQVSRMAPNLDRQMREDLCENLRQLIQTKVLQQEDGGFDLRSVYAEGRSACGWARQFAKTATRSELRNIRNRTDRYLNVDPVTPVQDDTVGHRSYIDYAFHTNMTEDQASNHDAVEHSLETIYDQFNEAANGARKGRMNGLGRRGHIGAIALRAAYGLPELVRPEMLDREYVRQELEADERLAQRAAAAMLSLVTAYEDEAQQKIDDRLLALFDDFTAHQLQLLVDKPATVAHLLAVDAVSQYPRPNRDAVEQAISLMVSVSGNDVDRKSSREFRPSAKRLVDAWVASECEAVSAYNLKGRLATDGYSDDETRAFRELEDEVFEEKRMETALDWPDLARWATTLPGAPFGGSDREVSEWIRTAIGTFANDTEFTPAGVTAAA